MNNNFLERYLNNSYHFQDEDLVTQSDIRAAAKQYKCSFCGKDRNQVEHMIEGPVASLYICNECVDFSFDVLHHETDAEVPTKKKKEKMN